MIPILHGFMGGRVAGVLPNTSGRRPGGHHHLDYGKGAWRASGGFTSGRKAIVEYLRQRSRPYLFSNSVAPPIVYASMAAIDLIDHGDDLRKTLRENTAYFRGCMKSAGFNIAESTHPIVPIMLGEAKLAQDMARDLLEEGILRDRL